MALADAAARRAPRPPAAAEARSEEPVDLGQGRPQRALPLRLRQEIQAVPRRGGAGLSSAASTAAFANYAGRRRPRLLRSARAGDARSSERVHLGRPCRSRGRRSRRSRLFGLRRHIGRGRAGAAAPCRPACDRRRWSRSDGAAGGGSAARLPASAGTPAPAVAATATRRPPARRWRSSAGSSGTGAAATDIGAARPARSAVGARGQHRRRRGGIASARSRAALLARFEPATATSELRLVLRLLLGDARCGSAPACSSAGSRAVGLKVTPVLPARS